MKVNVKYIILFLFIITLAIIAFVFNNHAGIGACIGSAVFLHEMKYALSPKLHFFTYNPIKMWFLRTEKLNIYKTIVTVNFWIFISLAIFSLLFP